MKEAGESAMIARHEEGHEVYEGRTKLGRFKAGVSGNPKGKPKTDPLVKEILKAHSVKAAHKLIELLSSESDKIAFMAAQEILNRTEGKPQQSLNMELSGGLDMRGQIREILLGEQNGESKPESRNREGITSIEIVTEVP